MERFIKLYVQLITSGYAARLRPVSDYVTPSGDLAHVIGMFVEFPGSWQTAINISRMARDAGFTSTDKGYPAADNVIIYGPVYQYNPA